MLKIREAEIAAEKAAFKKAQITSGRADVEELRGIVELLKQK